MNPMNTYRYIILAFLLFFTTGLILRHDVSDQDYIDFAKDYHQLCHFADGEGTLIAPEWVITTAHVAVPIENNLRFDSQMLICNGQEYEVESVIVHPDFEMSPTSITSDIALVRIKDEVAGVESAKLYPNKDEVGKLITVIGRGDTGTGLTGPTKMDKITRAGTNIIDGVNGEWIYFKFDHPDSPNTTPLEAVSGPGDSGGPAFYDSEDTRYVVGLSSYQIGDGSGAGRYGVTEYYTRVSEFKNWIEQSMIEYKPVEIIPTNEISSDLARFIGTYEGDRVIKSFQNTLHYSRENGPFIKLVLKEDNLYKFELPRGVVSANPLPFLKFNFDDNDEVIGISVIHEDRNEDFKKLDM
jgi:hypothetical protein